MSVVYSINPLDIYTCVFGAKASINTILPVLPIDLR